MDLSKIFSVYTRIGNGNLLKLTHKQLTKKGKRIHCRKSRKNRNGPYSLQDNALIKYPRYFKKNKRKRGQIASEIQKAHCLASIAAAACMKPYSKRQHTYLRVRGERETEKEGGRVKRDGSARLTSSKVSQQLNINYETSKERHISGRCCRHRCCCCCCDSFLNQGNCSGASNYAT